jgi:hypothetical protein
MNKIKQNIEQMSVHHQIEVLRILKKGDKVVINENNNGSFINLNELSPEILQELEKYIQYVNEQQQQLNSVEIKKEELEHSFFNK